MKFKLLLLLIFIVKQSSQANILLVDTLLSHSHHFWNEAVAIGLVEKGHNVTMLSHDHTKIKRDNFTVITLEGIHGKFDYSIESTKEFTITPFTILSFIDSFFFFNLEICRMDINHPTFHQVLLSYPKEFKFDIILWDHTAGECLYPIIERFGNPPLIGLSPFGLTNSIEDIYGGHVYSYVGQVVMPFVEATNIWQRLLNVIFINYSNYQRRTTLKQKSIDLSRTVFKDWDEFKYAKVEERFSLSLINWNSALNQPQPMIPNLIPVGGVQIKDNEKLPKDLESIFSKAKSGVIFFSLGSNIKSEFLSFIMLQSFGQCFAELPDYQIIWKLIPPAGLKLPPNVNAVPWAPQTAILSQKQTKVFISHGGGLSIQETTYFGVPVLAVPIFLDQINNAKKLKAKDGGEIVNINEMDKSEYPNELFCQQLKEVVFNEKYSKAMKELSAKYRDVPMKPLETAVYWVEYVLRHGDIIHMSPLSRKMGIFFTQNLDIYLIVVGLLVLQVYIFYALSRCMWRRCFQKAAEKVKTN